MINPAGAAAQGGDDPAGDSQEEAAARQLTHNIAYADSVFQLADIFTAHASVMDMIHITACITRLSKVLGTSPSQASQAAAASLLPLLGNKLLSVLPNANARGIANVLWGYGRLRSLPQVQLLSPLVEAFLKQLPNAACRDSAVVLWSLARLSEGQGEPADATVQPALLRRLGREVLQQLATAAHDSPAQAPGQQQQQPGTAQQQRQQTPGTPGAAAGGGGGSEQGKADDQEGAEASGPPSSRDVSNSLMALARLGFLPEDDTTTAATAVGTQPASTAAAATRQQQQQQPGGQSPPLAAQLQRLSLAGSSTDTSAATAAGSSSQQPQQLTLPLSQIKAVVEYLLRMAATAKTLDLQETATALKQLGLRELHARVAASFINHQGTAHGGPGHSGGMHGPGMQYMSLGGPGGRMGQFSRQGGVGAPYGGMMQQQRRQQQMGMSGPLYGQGWVPSQGFGQYEGGSMRQMAPGAYMNSRQRGPAGQAMRPPAMGQQQQPQPPQQAFMLSVSPAGAAAAAAPRHSMTGFTPLGAMAGGVQAVGYGESPAAAGASPAAAGYSLQYAGEQQPPGLLQQQSGGYAPAVQYMLVAQQPQQQAVGGYVVQQQVPQQQQGEFLGVPVLQQQAAGEQAPPGLVGAAAGGAVGQQQYFMQTASTPALMMPQGVGVMADAAAGQQLFLQYQQASGGVAGGPGLGSLSQLGAAGVFQSSSGMMVSPEYVPEAMTSSALTASVVGDIFLSGQQQQGQRSQLQLLQRQVGQQVGLYQQPQQQQQAAPASFTAQAPGPVYLQQAQQQQLYGGQQPVQGQQFVAPQAGSGAFVLDPTTGMYHFQQ